MIISTLEELSLHQENIDKIEHVQDWCRDLQILLLQGNLIHKIENLGKLKKLNYLNLALNNIEKVENLEKLESLTKLDLTLNFIGDLESISNLKNNYNLRELNLTGNPCSDYPRYRQFVIHTLPQLDILDSKDITKADKLAASIEYSNIVPAIKKHQQQYFKFREEQKVRVTRQIQENQHKMSLMDSEEERNKFFWDSKSEHSPESRVDVANKQMENERLKQRSSETKKENPPRRLFMDNGNPLNVNEAKVEFTFKDHVDSFELEVFVPKYCDTELLTVDVQVNYVRVTVKNKVFQLALREDVRIHESTSKRSQITGYLLIEMPKLNYDTHLVAKEKMLQEKMIQNKKIKPR